MSKIHKVHTNSLELENMHKFQSLAKGSLFGLNRVESEYIKLENDLLKSTTLAAHKLLRVLSPNTVRRFLDDHSEYSRMLEELKHSKFVIKKNNPIKMIFDFLVNVIIVYSVLNGLYFLSFGMDEDDSSPVEIVAWVFFLIDFCLNFFTEYMAEKKYPIRNLYLISLRYCKTWLVFDLLALLPLKIFGYKELEYFFRMSRILKINRVFNTFATKNFTNYLRSRMTATTAKTQKCFLILETFTDFCLVICKFIYFCYFFACCWYYLSSKVEDKYSDDKHFLKAFDIHAKPKNEQVLIILYFIFTTLTTVGYGDYLAKNSEEMALCIFIMLVGSAWLALTMSKVMSFVKEFEKIGKPKDNLSELTVFVHSLEHIHGPMPSVLKSKLFKHFQYFWKNNRLGCLMNPDWSVKGNQLTFIHDKTLRKLPQHIQSDIIEYLFQDYFTQFVKFFGYADRFRFDIALHLQPRFHDQEFILFMEERAKELLFIKTGTVLVGFLKDDQSFVTCFNLPEGVIVGESSVFLDENSFADLKAEKVHGMALPENAIIEILKQKYPGKLKEYVLVVKKRMESLKRALRDSENFEQRYQRSRISARLSAVFHKTLEKPGLFSVRDLYLNMKSLTRMQEKLRKEIESINSTYFD